MRALVSVVFVCGIVALLLVSGCTDILLKQKAGGFGQVPATAGTGGGTGGGTGTGKGGGSSSGSYPQNTYFSFDCKGEYRATGIKGEPPWNHHGKFTLTGNVPFPIPYDYNNPMGHALYTDQNTGDKGNPLHIQSELSGCWGPANDCKPCHFIFDGEIYAQGHMVYNHSMSGSKWTASFSRRAGESGIWNTKSISQTEGSCPFTQSETETEIVELTAPAWSCYTSGKSAFGTPFDFSDGSGFKVSPYVEPQDIAFTTFDPSVTFHIGRPPS